MYVCMYILLRGVKHQSPLSTPSVEFEVECFDLGPRNEILRSLYYLLKNVVLVLMLRERRSRGMKLNKFNITVEIQFPI
jgi:hypothetical protein